jgi:hypothetical protein
MLAITIFLLIITLTFAVSSNITTRVNFWETENERNETAMHASNSLLLSSGNPSNWQDVNKVSDINAIGLANTRNSINDKKLQKLLDLNASNYANAKELMGLAKYDLYFSVKDINGYLFHEFGLFPDANTEITTIERIALWKEKNIIMKLQVWKK